MRVRPSEPCELRKVCCGRLLRWQAEEGAPPGVRPPSEGRDGDRQNTTASCSPSLHPFFFLSGPLSPQSSFAICCLLLPPFLRRSVGCCWRIGGEESLSGESWSRNGKGGGEVGCVEEGEEGGGGGRVVKCKIERPGRKERGEERRRRGRCGMGEEGLLL